MEAAPVHERLHAGNEDIMIGCVLAAPAIPPDQDWARLGPAPDTHIYFCKTSDQYAFMSNMCPAPVSVDGIGYRTSEHAFQAGKAHLKYDGDGEELRRVIGEMQAESAVKLKRTNRRICPLSGEERNVWDRRESTKRMLACAMAKFEPSSASGRALADALLATGDRILIERVTGRRGDKIWGVDERSVGENRMGRILMYVRAHLRVDSERREQLGSMNHRITV